MCELANLKFTTYLGIVGLYAHRNELAHRPRTIKPYEFVKPDTDGNPTIDWKGVLEECLQELTHSTLS